MAKSKETKEIIEKIKDYTLEEIMGERFGSYSKYIIQERAIPDARDGLKPVQRRIIYSMHHEKNTYDHPYRKSAKTVGDVIGNYHPHGDTSIYDAMVRMSQDWKARDPYIDMHGNNGSIDGDSPAAYRYTEARLSKISNEMIRDIDKNTVMFAPNFDDSTVEPTVLPVRFPALLVYGSTGISAGYATNIPPHNLSEVIDATIYRIDNKDASLEELMNFVKGPDFPTGAIIEGKDGLIEAYKTGRGKIVVRSKTSFEKNAGKESIIIEEIPFEVNKAMLVKKIDDIRIDKKIDGISEVRDESDSKVRIAIDLKKGANKELILNYLYKNTDVQSSYNFNMVSIVNKCPRQLGLVAMIDAFIAHKKEVVTKRTEFDLATAEKRLHIVEGLIKCISILDEVIRVIRASKNKSDAKTNLVEEFEFTYEQAEAIVILQLYRLTNTDVVLLEEEQEKLEKIIKGLNKILTSNAALKKVMKDELEKIKNEYGRPRLTEIKDEVTDIKIDTSMMIPKEDVVVTITKDGYIKRTSYRSYNKTEDEVTLKENDYLIGKYEMNTMDTLLIFTSLGNYLFIPAHVIPDSKWKDMGKHISNLIPIGEDEEVISGVPVKTFESDKNIILISKNGMIKKTPLKDFKVSRYSKPVVCMKLKEDDKVIDAYISTKPNLFITTSRGYALTFKEDEVGVVGVRASGVKAVKLTDDYVVSLSEFDDTDEYITVVTDRATLKRVKLTEFPLLSRARKGIQIIRDVKTKPYRIIKSFITSNKKEIGIKNSNIKLIKVTEIPILDRYSTGKEFLKKEITDSFILQNDSLNSSNESTETIPKKEQINLEDIDKTLKGL